MLYEVITSCHCLLPLHFQLVLPPDRFPDAPVGAIERACAKAGLTPKDIGLYEINEAFAAVTMIA